MRSQAVAAGHRVGGHDRPMRAEEPTRHERFGGLAGKIIYVVGSHLPVVGRLCDRRMDMLLLDVEELLDRELSKEDRN